MLNNTLKGIDTIKEDIIDEYLYDKFCIDNDYYFNNIPENEYLHKYGYYEEKEEF